jgi:undecaprenyl-diphosphatase
MLARPAHWLALALALFAAGVVLGLAGRAGPVLFDEGVQPALTSLGRHAPANWAVEAIDGAADVVVWTPLVVVVAGWLWRSGARGPAVLVAASDLAAEALTFVLKAAIGRRAPGEAEHSVLLALYPSGHVMRVAVVVALLWVIRARQGRSGAAGAAAGLAVVLAVGVARVASGKHMPTDVVGALLIAGAYILAVLAVAGWQAGRRDGSARLGGRRHVGAGQDLVSLGEAQLPQPLADRRRR